MKQMQDYLNNPSHRSEFFTSVILSEAKNLETLHLVQGDN
jgi:hypothetical protein